jgi:hypothetical protein
MKEFAKTLIKAIIGIVIVALIVIILYFTIPGFKNWVNDIGKKATYVVSSGFKHNQSYGEHDPLSSGVKEAWYSTVTSDNDHYMEDYQQRLEGTVVTGKMKAQHVEWANEIGPKSRTIMMVGDIDEAATMSTPRYGLNSFRFETPTTHGCKSQFVEGDDYRDKYSSVLRLGTSSKQLLGSAAC